MAARAAARRARGRAHARDDHDRRGGQRAAASRPARCSRPSRSCSTATRCGWSWSAATTASTRSSCATRSGADFRPARPDEVAERLGPPGFIGPVGAEMPILLDAAVAPGAYVTGANEPDAHLRGVEPGRDFPFERVDVRTRGRRRHRRRRARSGSSRRSRSATSSSWARATPSRSAPPTSTSPGKEQLIWMGCYGFGPARAAAAAVEQYADEQGISWPRAIAPFDVELVDAGQGRAARSARSPTGSTASCRSSGSTSSTTTATPGRGRSSPTPSCSAAPLRVTVGRRTLAAGEVEVQLRRGRETTQRAARGRGARRSPSSGAGCREPRPHGGP